MYNVWGDNDDSFHALNRQLNKDVVNLDWTAHGSHTLGSGSFYNPSDNEKEEIHVVYEAGTYRLSAGAKSSLGSFAYTLEICPSIYC